MRDEYDFSSPTKRPHMNLIALDNEDQQRLLDVVKWTRASKTEVVRKALRHYYIVVKEKKFNTAQRRKKNEP